MSSFLDDLTRFTAKTERTLQDGFVASCADAKDSIVNGSAVTGAPGQVVADEHGGQLKGSWQLRFESPTVAVIETACPWAPQNEDGIARPGGGPYVQRSATGGRWSVRKTIIGWPRIVEAAFARIVK